MRTPAGNTEGAAARFEVFAAAASEVMVGRALENQSAGSPIPKSVANSVGGNLDAERVQPRGHVVVLAAMRQSLCPSAPLSAIRSRQGTITDSFNAIACALPTPLD